MKFYTKSYNTAHHTLGMLLHYLGKLKLQIFSRYSVDLEENSNKLHFECTGRSADCRVKRPRTPFHPQRRQSVADYVDF